jgi:DNA-binding HxlR family transcriptional regulator
MLLKWSLPVLWVLGDGPARFCELRCAINGIGDRALSMSLKDLRGADMIRREILKLSPPAAQYESTRTAGGLIRILRRL